MSTTILIIEDDTNLSWMLQLRLQKEQYTCITAPDGMTGLHLLYEHHPDLIILDIMMPGMDGWKTCQHIRRMTDVPIIMLTAKSEISDKLRGLSMGADDYITKPFDIEELVLRVHRVLHRARRPTAPLTVYRIGSLTIDLVNQRVFRSGQEVPLSTREFALLACLAQRPGEVVPQSALRSMVWGTTTCTRSCLKTYIRRLREKLEDDPDNPDIILTDWGIGYHIRAPTSTSETKL
jgi:DNA-binding response OmpR family regulator